MGNYSHIVIGLCLIAGSFFLPAHNQVGESMVWTLRLLGGFFIVLPCVGFLRKNYRHRKEKKKKNFFLKRGIKATATLLSAQRTGAFLNKVPQILFELKINSGGKKEYVIKVKKYIRFVDLSEISEGMIIPAYIHPEDDGKVFLMWGKAGIGDAF